MPARNASDAQIRRMAQAGSHGIFQVTAKHAPGEPIFATAAIAAGKFCIHTAGHLFCFVNAVR